MYPSAGRALHTLGRKVGGHVPPVPPPPPPVPPPLRECIRWAVNEAGSVSRPGCAGPIYIGLCSHAHTATGCVSLCVHDVVGVGVCIYRCVEG